MQDFCVLTLSQIKTVVQVLHHFMHSCISAVKKTNNLKAKVVSEE